MPAGFWRTLFRPPALSGATLDSVRTWEVSSPPRPIRLAPAFRVLLTEQGVVALEGLSIHPQVKQALQPYVVIPTLEIRRGTLYPASEWIHIGTTADALSTLDDLVNSCAGPEICNHLYAYENGILLLEWHDAFDDPIHMTAELSASVIAAFSAALGAGPAKAPSQ